MATPGIRITCPNCQQQMVVPEAVRGKKVRCKKCGGVVPVPAGGGVDTRMRTEQAQAKATTSAAHADDDAANPYGVTETSLAPRCPHCAYELDPPDSRICLERNATPEFRTSWEDMCRTSYRTYSTLLGLPGNPIEFIDQYEVSGLPGIAQAAEEFDTRPEFAELQSELTPDLLPRGVSYSPGRHPFGNRYVRKTANLMFNIAEYSRYLLSEFQSNGGRIVMMEFHSPEEFGNLAQNTLINCTGYGARALLGDDSVIPVRGQLARMAPQPGVHYAVLYRSTLFLGRRDEFVFQHFAGEYQGFNDETTEPDRGEAELAVNRIGRLGFA